MAQGFGRDLWCQDYLVTTRLASGFRALAQACFRRLTTSRGTLRGIGKQQAEAEVYGIDLSELVGNTDPDRVERELPGRIRAELGKDDRVRRVVVSMTRTSSPSAARGVDFTIVIEVFAADPAENFRLTLSASAAATELVSVTGLAA